MQPEFTLSGAPDGMAPPNSCANSTFLDTAHTEVEAG